MNKITYHLQDMMGHAPNAAGHAPNAETKVFITNLRENKLRFITGVNIF